MLHALLVRSVAEALYGIFCENRHADKVIEYTLKQNPKAGSHDRAFIAETTYEIVRYYRLYTEVWGNNPRSAADFWTIVAIHLIHQGHRTLPAWQEWKDLNIPGLSALLAEKSNHRAIAQSIPDWLDQLGAAELNTSWDTTLEWLNRPARVVLRTNRLKTDRPTLLRDLAAEGIATEFLGTADALVLQKRQNVFRTRAFRAGHFEVQDYSSQLVAPLLAPQAGMRVIDACAGGGGKTLHLSALMQNKGQLIALDTLAWKLDALRLRARRAGATNIETRCIENRKVIKRLYGTADRLLLDVPCSGLGVLRRNPDTKWKISMEQIEQLRQTQAEILQHYAPMLKTGGRMVYATCSILPSENTRQAEQFLDSATGRSFALLEERSILPQEEGFDGFYMALLEKKA